MAQSLINDDMTLEEKLAAIDAMIAQKEQTAEDASTTSNTNVNVADDPVLDLMCGDACQ